VGQPRVIVLRTAGTNCDEETAYAWTLAGAIAERIHINRLIERPGLLDRYQVLTIPGGFSYGDDIAAGKILANQIVHHLADAMHAFLEAGKLILGICNGFQVLVKSGLLPNGLQRAADKAGPGAAGRQVVTLAANDSGKFEDRWVHLRAETDRCVFLQGGERLFLPVAHAEGKLVARAGVLEQLRAGGYVALRYVDEAGRPGPYPVNPNGSEDDIAALTDATGRVLGLMPHPERHVHRTHHPLWTRREDAGEPDGLRLFRRAVAYLQG